MSKLRVTCDGNQHCTALQKKKGKTVATDCPYTSKGEEFSPTELVGAGLAGCMLMSVGTLAMRDKLDISGTCVDVDVSTMVSRIGAIDLRFTMPRNFSAADRVKLEKAAGTCPIKKSFHPDIMISVHFNYPEQKGDFLNCPFCEKTNCVNYEKRRCVLKNPEKDEGFCLHYEDMMDSVRLKADVFKGALKRE